MLITDWDQVAAELSATDLAHALSQKQLDGLVRVSPPLPLPLGMQSTGTCCWVVTAMQGNRCCLELYSFGRQSAHMLCIDRRILERHSTPLRHRLRSSTPRAWHVQYDSVCTTRLKLLLMRPCCEAWP